MFCVTINERKLHLHFGGCVLCGYKAINERKLHLPNGLAEVRQTAAMPQQQQRGEVRLLHLCKQQPLPQRHFPGRRTPPTSGSGPSRFPQPCPTGLGHREAHCQPMRPPRTRFCQLPSARPTSKGNERIFKAFCIYRDPGVMCTRIEFTRLNFRLGRLPELRTRLSRTSPSPSPPSAWMSARRGSRGGTLGFLASSSGLGSLSAPCRTPLNTT